MKVTHKVFNVIDSKMVSLVLASEFGEMKVYGVGMQFMGKVKDLVVDPGKCLLTDFVVELDSDAANKAFPKRFGIGKTKVRVPISVIDKIGDAIILKFGIDQLESNVKRI
jgi:sporulation protein YlmC with PRC-barrel domain